MQRPHAELTPVARVTYELLREAVESRWFRPRYKHDHTRPQDKVFDMQALCHPTLSNLKYIDSMVDCDATDVKRKIENVFLELVVNTVGNVERKSTYLDAAHASPAKKRARHSSGKGDSRTTAPLAPICGKGSRANVIRSNEFVDLGLITTVPDVGPRPLTTVEKAKEELREFRRIPGVNLGN